MGMIGAKRITGRNYINYINTFYGLHYN